MAAALNVVALLISLLAAGAAGKPPSAEEQRLFDEGMRAYQSGDARAAEKAWRAGYLVGKDPAFLVRIAEAQEKAGAAAEAIYNYSLYLRQAPDAADRVEIRRRIEHLGGYAAASPSGMAENDVPTAFGDAPAPTPASPPTPPPAAAPLRPPPPPGAGVGQPAAGQPAAGEESSGWNRLNVTAWIASGVVVAALGTAGYYAASAASKKDDANQLLHYRDPVTGAPLEYHTVASRYLDATRDGQHDDRVAKGALLVAAGAAAVAVVFFVLDGVSTPADPEASQLSLGVAVQPEAGKAAALTSLRWRF